MYLNYLQIVNYKNLKATRFQFSKGANTIIGENDSGKSNAMTAIRMLLDDSYYYNTKRLTESDFSDCINWRGHWIILSAIFSEITSEDKQTEVCAELIPDKENESFLKSYIKSGDENIGVITLFIRPQKSIRKKLCQAKDKKSFDDIRNAIKLSDYEFYYTSRAQTDFTQRNIYREIVGDIDSGECVDPDKDNDAILGRKLCISDVQNHISVVFIDALRDVTYEMHKPKNPIRRIVESIESKINDVEIDNIKKNIVELNKSISEVEQVGIIADSINKKLVDMIGMVYSPEIALASEMKDDLKTLSRYLSMKPSRQSDLELLGLGHLNMIYMALKIVEYEFNRTRELINIMIIEEPEAHIHTHIQKTLFDKLNISKDYTQIIMTTHSTHLSEVSEIRNVNVLKSIGNISYAMHPINELDEFGTNNLLIKNLKLSDCIERYLDAKRSVLLFSKGVILVEGDGEEILIPNMIKQAFGISLDELGIGLVNVGSTSFEYIACLFSDERINRYCSIITDLDKQVVDVKSSFYSIEAEKIGANRKEKLNKLFGDNNWVDTFYADNTIEIEFAKYSENLTFIEEVIDLNYVQSKTIEKHKSQLKDKEELRADTILTLAQAIGKGWYATLLSNYIDVSVQIPDYILDAIAFSCREVINLDIALKIVDYSVNGYEDSTNKKKIKAEIRNAKTVVEKDGVIKDFKIKYKNDIVTRFLKKLKKYDISFGD